MQKFSAAAYTGRLWLVWELFGQPVVVGNKCGALSYSINWGRLKLESCSCFGVDSANELDGVACR